MLTAKAKSSRQKQKAHGKNKKLTAKAKTSRQKQKAHGKSKKVTAKKRSRQKQKAHGKNKMLTAKTKSSRQKRKAHGKNKHRHAMRAEPMTFFFFLQYVEIYPDNLWVCTPPVSPTLTPQLPPPPPKKILWFSTIKPGNDRAA